MFSFRSKLITVAAVGAAAVSAAAIASHATSGSSSPSPAAGSGSSAQRAPAQRDPSQAGHTLNGNAETLLTGDKESKVRAAALAKVPGTVERVETNVAVAYPVALDRPEPADAIRAHAPDGVDRIIEVALSENADLDAAVAAKDGVIAAYATRRDRPEIPFWPMLFANVTIRLLGSDDFSTAAKRQAAADLTTAAREGALSIRTGEPLPLRQVAEAHDRVDAGARERVLLSIPS